MNCASPPPPPRTPPQNFHSWRVFVWENEVDQLPVLRLAVMLKPETNVDFVLKQLGVALKFHEILVDLNCELHFSHSLTEMLESKKFVLDDKFGSGLSASVVVARKILVRLAEELQHFVEEKRAGARIEFEERKEAYGWAHARTKDALEGKFKEGVQGGVQEMTITG